jgi:hypothetical protein
MLAVNRLRLKEQIIEGQVKKGLDMSQAQALIFTNTTGEFSRDLPHRDKSEGTFSEGGAGGHGSVQAWFE